MHADSEQIIERPGDLTAAWLTAAIGAGPVADFAVERIGTGQMSECYRIRLNYADAGSDGPESVVLKVAATDPVSRQTGSALGLYEREVRFYGDIAPRLAGPIAPCYQAAIDTSTGVFDLLLGDAGPAVVGDEITGATIEQARLGVVELGRLQGPLLGDTALAEASWLNRETPLNQAMIASLYAGFLDRYGDQIAPEHRVVCERLVAAFDGYVEARRGQPDSGSGARRLPAGQHAVRHRRSRSRADGGRLADRFPGSGADRSVLLSRMRAANAGSSGPLRRIAAGLPRGAGTRGAHRPRRRRRRCAPPKLFRCDDGDRLVNAGGAHRTR